MAKVIIRHISCLFIFFCTLSTPLLQAFEPFFDDDIHTHFAPQVPTLTALDSDFLTLCGAWGQSVKAIDFEKMMLSPTHKQVLNRLRKALDNQIFSDTTSDKALVQQLRRVWFEQKGFEHVFCGEPSEKRLGGFHYTARFWQAQQQQWAGYRALKKNYQLRPIPECRRTYIKEQIKPPIYSTSVKYLIPNSDKQGVKCLSGYHYLMDGEAILLAGTLAFKEANRRVSRNAKEACLHETQIDNVPKHFSQLVIKKGALRTFYPLAGRKPYCRKNKRNIKACYCTNL